MFNRLILLLVLFTLTACGDATAASKGQVFDALLVSQRAGGVTLAGGKAYFYVPGTTTYKAIYADRNKTTPAANPYTLSADGTAMVYGDGLYDVKITNSAGVQKFLWEDVQLRDALSTFIEVSTYAELLASVTSADAAGGTVRVTAPIVVTSAISWPSDRAIEFSPGGYVTFTGSGALTGLKEARPEWFAVNTTPGTTDMSGAWTKAIAAVSGSSAHVGTVLAQGRYGIASSIDGSGKNNYTIRGVPAGTPYGGGEAASAYAGTVIVPAAGWAADTPVINMRQSKNSHVYDVGILMANGGNGYGIALGNTSGTDTYPNHNIERVAVFGGQRGISARYAGLIKATGNNISNASEQGVYSEVSGDSDYDGNYIQNTNVSYIGDTLSTGAAMYFVDGGGGVSIRGGKIEYNAKGIVFAKNSSRTRVTGVEFDANRFFHIASMSTGTGTIDFNNTIVGNSFSGGGTVEDSSGIGKASIVVGHYGTVSSIMSRGTVTGNSFTQNSDGLINPEDGTGVNPGPTTAAIKLLKGGAVTGSMYWQVSGNMMAVSSLLYNIYADGPSIYVKSGDFSNLANYSANGASIRNYQLEPVWSNFAFDAANFSASTGNHWTVASGDQKHIRYTVSGKVMTLTFSIFTTTVSNAPTYLTLKVPGGYTVESQADSFYSHVFIRNGGATQSGVAFATQAGTTIRFYKDPSFTTAYTNETDLTGVFGTITFPIQ